MGVFADNVVAYYEAGWPCVLPVPPHTKHPPPVGYTGASGKDTDPGTLVDWVTGYHDQYGRWQIHADDSIALRLPEGIIGIDVDHYDKVSSTGQVTQKRGGDQIAELEAKLGPLPPTWISSARPAPSGIRFYRVPAGRYRTKLGDSIEIIQRHHRYAVVAPSTHEEAGTQYGWIPQPPHEEDTLIHAWGVGDPYPGEADSQLPDGSPLPAPHLLPELPEAWVAHLREGATEAGHEAADVGSGHAMLSTILVDDRPECADVTEARERARRLMTEADAGSRHDTATERVHHLVNLGASGHPGVGAALDEIRTLWAELTAGEGREDEYERMLLTSARKAVTAVGGPAPVPADPCLLIGGFQVPAPAPSYPDGTVGALEAGEQPVVRYWSPREHIGTYAFDPAGMLDHTLADAVLQRMWPVLRYAVDAGTWILRGPELWEPRGDLTKWAVHELASLMPHGDPDADKGSPEATQAERRKKLMSSNGRNAVGATMTAAVAAGTHPCSVDLSRLDTEPWLLWAGGRAWDLRACQDTLTGLDIDPGTPHLHSAAVAPMPGPTPTWDAFLAAVWPDEEVRAWAVRVLSVPFTGYARKFLPILWGEKDTGKTQVVMLLMSVLGTYAHAADVRLLSAGESHASIVYALKGRRLSFIDEGPREGKWAAERLKALTGGGELTGNRMRENPVTFQTTHKLVLTANNAPPLTDPAIRSRVRLVPCEGDVGQVLAARRAFGEIGGAVWQREAPGILATMMREAALWIADEHTGTTEAAPEHIRTAADEIGMDQDPIRTWVEDETEPHPDGTAARILREDFVAWARRNDIKPLPTVQAWGRELTKLGYPASRNRYGKVRPLRPRPLGNWSPDYPQPVDNSVTSPLPVTDVVTVCDRYESTSVTGADQPKPYSVTDVTDVLPVPTTTKNRGHIENIQETGGLRTEGHKRSSIGGFSAGQADNSTCDPIGHAPHEADLPAQLALLEPDRPSPAPKRASRAKLTDEEKAHRKEEAAAKRRAAAEEKRATALAAAAGPTVVLPALLDRASGVLRPVSLEEAAAIVSGAHARSGAVTVDVETTGRPLGHREYALKTIQLGDAFQTVDFDAADPAQAALIRDLTEAPKLHAFSAGADLNPLIHAGLADESIWDRMYDVVIPAKLADPTAAKGGSDGLKDLAPAVLGDLALSPAAEKAKNAMFAAGGWKTTKIDYTDPIEKIGWAQADPQSTTMARYACSDVLDTGALALALPWPRPELMDRERTVEAMTARIGLHGWPLDEPKVRQLIEVMEAKKTSALDRARTEGVDNPGSPKQLAERLQHLGAELPRTDKGNLSTDKKVIARLEVTDGPWRPLVDALKDYREAQNRLGLFLGPWLDMCVNGDGRMRPTVYTLEARTGRMSCVRPNLQQVPKFGGYRSAVLADPGYVFISADFAGVEIRVAAALSQDPKLLAYIADEDRAPEGDKVGLHWAIAHQVWGPDATPKHRKTAKIGVFSTFYGSGADNLAGQLGISIETAKQVQTTLFNLIPDYRAWSNDLMRQAQAGHLAYPAYSGRTLWLPGDRPYASGNTAVQGTARELLVDGMLEWRQTRWGHCTLLPVHDELIGMVREEEAEEATAELVRCMERDLFGVRIKVEASTPSPFWLDGD